MVNGLPHSARRFTGACRTALGARLRAVVLVGSFARGDASPASDLDLIVLVDRADVALLDRVGAVVASIESPHEINPSVIAVAELRAAPELFDWLLIKHEGRLLDGQLPADIACCQTELDLAQKIAEVLLSARHYLAVAEPAANFAGGKLRPWILKPLSYALRFYEVHRTGHYPRRYADVASRYPALALDPVRDHRRLLEAALEICETILAP
jgi:predicted nucleotidyltransferase